MRGLSVSLRNFITHSVIKRAGAKGVPYQDTQLIACTFDDAKERLLKRLSRMKIGGAEEIRTPYLRNANATFSQVNYGPVSQNYSIDLTFFIPAFDSPEGYCYPQKKRL